MFTVIRRPSFRAVPWKNGGGITHEALRVPAQGAAFRWRVSVAEIDVSGPFSEFAEHQRTLVLLRGAGVHLKFGGQTTTLRHIGDLAEFDGALSTQCELLEGPCADLNLMVVKSMTGVRAWVERVWAPCPLGPAHPGTLLVFAISGELTISAANGESTRLEPWDLAVVSSLDHAVVSPRDLVAPADPLAAPLAFFAALGDNSPSL